MSRIVLGISSGIAAYKIIDLAILLKKKGHVVTVIMTPQATKICKPETFLHEKIPLYSELFPKGWSLSAILESRKVDHIEVAQNADLFVIAPATANTIAKLAHGQADDFLTTAALATTAHVMVFPSMNTVMWYHPATQENLTKLMSYGYEVIAPDAGPLACGTDGIGRLPAIDAIAGSIEQQLTVQQSLRGKNIIVTAGGTNEPIDAVRSISNRSTGKMGVAIAEACSRMGADVTLMRSTTSVRPSMPMREITFETAKDLETILSKEVPQADILFHTAAVADYTTDPTEGKIESAQELTLKLTPAPKIINQVKKWNPNILLVGFKAVHGMDTIENTVKKKFAATDADYLVVNDISRHDIGFGAEENEFIVYDKKGIVKKIEKASKREIAVKLVKIMSS